MLEPTNEAISAIINFITRKDGFTLRMIKALVTGYRRIFLKIPVFAAGIAAREQRGRLGFSWRLGAGRLAVLEGRMGVSYMAGREKAGARALALQRRLG